MPLLLSWPAVEALIPQYFVFMWKQLSDEIQTAAAHTASRLGRAQCSRFIGFPVDLWPPSLQGPEARMDLIRYVGHNADWFPNRRFLVSRLHGSCCH